LLKRNILVIVVYIATLFAVIPLAPLARTLFPLTFVEAVIYSTIISFIIGLFITYQLLKKDIRAEKERNEAGVTTKRIVLWSIYGLVLAYGAQIIANIIETSLFNVELGSENTFMIMDISRQFPFFMLVPMFIAPILEELVFRKVLFGSLYKRTNFFIAAIVSAFIFGIIHGEPEHLLIYASMGLVFSYVYVKTKRIIVPIIVHMAMNSVTVIAQFSIDPEQLEQLQNGFIHLL